MKASIILPTYNEAANIVGLIERVEGELKASKIKGEIIVVDDNSPDCTWRIVKKLAKTHKNLKLVKNRKKQGIGAAYIAGILASHGDVIVTMDADNSHDPKFLTQLVAAIGKECGCAVGSRYIRGGEIIGWGRYRKTMSRAANSLARRLLRLRTHDVTSGYRAYSRKTIRAIGLKTIRAQGYSFLTETIFKVEKSGVHVKEIPIIFVDRKKGSSKLGLLEQPKFVKTLLRLMLSAQAPPRQKKSD